MTDEPFRTKYKVDIHDRVTLRSLLSCHFFIGSRPYDQALRFCENHGYDPDTPILVEGKRKT